MNDNQNVLRNSILIFMLCLTVRILEVILIRTDETILAECFINKAFGIILLSVILHFLNWQWKDIGFIKERLFENIFKGFLVGTTFYALGFLAELIILISQNNPGHIEFFVSGFSLTGNVVKQTGIGFVLMSIFFNIINVWMEEGLFRGFYIKYLNRKFNTRKAIWIAALLFGLWHIVTPFRSLLDGELNLCSFIGMSIGYVVLSGMMGIKWGLFYKLTGSIWMGLADHFFNNCIVTNLLHVVTSTGVDEMQIARVLIGQLTSFTAVLIYMKIYKINFDSLEA